MRDIVLPHSSPARQAAGISALARDLPNRRVDPVALRLQACRDVMGAV